MDGVIIQWLSTDEARKQRECCCNKNCLEHGISLQIQVGAQEETTSALAPVPAATPVEPVMVSRHVEGSIAASNDPVLFPGLFAPMITDAATAEVVATGVRPTPHVGCVTIVSCA